MASTASPSRIREGRFAGLAGSESGEPGALGRAVLLLHGLTFDRTMWEATLEALPPGHRALALDLPGHGDSPSLAGHGLEEVVEAVHEAVAAAGLDEPVVVGHSISGVIASIYAATHPTAAVVNIDGPLGSPAPFIRAVQAVKPQLLGDGFDQVWERYRQSMHLERVPDGRRGLIAAGWDVPAERVRSYWAEFLEGHVDERVGWIEEQFDRVLAAITAAGIPYVGLAGDEVPEDDRSWLAERLPQGELIVWPCGHHFPHLEDPDRFTALLIGVVAGVPAPAASHWPR